MDEEILRESERHRAVEGVLQGLHAAMVDDDDYRKTFAGIAVVLLCRSADMPEGTTVAWGKHAADVERLIDAPIVRFTDDALERDVLRCRVLVKIVASVATGPEAALLRETFLGGAVAP